ncbi:MAG TPA: ProQ/FINO family protein [Gammaproteobacteria bacterium]|jgi:ProP effector|nr:ProQ/FINO family protein [Gammaproteobacteria bacterium]
MSNASLKEQLQAMASQLADIQIPSTVQQRAPKASEPVEKKHKKYQQSEKRFKQPVNRHPDNPGKATRAKPSWLDYVQYGVELLKTYFPAGFRSANEVKPLKKGIKQDLIKRLSTFNDIVTADKACMVKSLAYYVNTIAYHKSVVEGSMRIDLDGNPAGMVSTEEAQYSVERQQAKLQAKLQAKTLKVNNQVISHQQQAPATEETAPC